MDSAKNHLKMPDKLVLYHLPPEGELVIDAVSRLCYQTYLHLSGISYSPILRMNTDHMCPSGESSFVVYTLGKQPFILDTYESFVNYISSKKVGLSLELSEVEKMDEACLLSLITVKLRPALWYQMWANKRNVSECLRRRGRNLSWPLNKLVPRVVQVGYIWNYWSDFSRPLEEVLGDFEHACRILSDRLGNQKSFFPSRMTSLDVVVYSHIDVIFTKDLPSQELGKVVRQFDNLIAFHRTMLDLLTQKDLS